MADDLYIPSLAFHVSEAGHLVAALPKGWPERHVLAATSVECALAGWRGVEGGIQSNVRIDDDGSQLVVEIGDRHLRRQAVIALAASGHAVHGAERVREMPLSLGGFESSTPSKTPTRSRLPEDYLGVWRLVRKETASGPMAVTKELALRFQTLSGVYVEVRLPNELIDDSDSCEEPVVFAERSSSAGVLSAHGADKDVCVRDRRVDFHPFDGMADVGRVRWQADDKRVWVESALLGCSRASTETWHRVDDADGSDRVAALELAADEHGRQGFWVVIGTWFARVVGRHSGDVLSDVVCKSLPHLIKAYAEGLGFEPTTAIQGFETMLGRVEAPGIFRIVHDFDRAREGALLLDGSERQLRRDAVEDDVVVEALSKRRWRIRELPQNFSAFGKLKRSIA